MHVIALLFGLEDTSANTTLHVPQADNTISRQSVLKVVAYRSQGETTATITRIQTCCVCFFSLVSYYFHKEALTMYIFTGLFSGDTSLEKHRILGKKGNQDFVD